MTEKEKMEQGLWYDANYDRELLERRLQADDLCFRFGQTRPSDTSKREQILKELIPELGENVSVQAPFYADYGDRCRIGRDTFINHNVYLMDGGGIRVGKNCFIGPNCGLYTANHPLLASERNAGLERALPIVLKDNVWLGASVTILPGVTIGEGSVIGAGSVVTKDVPDHVVAAGNPCRVIRPITEEDTIFNPSDRIKGEES